MSSFQEDCPLPPPNPLIETHMRSSSRLAAVLATFALLAASSDGREVSMHRRIARSAADSATGFRNFLTAVFGPGMDDRTATPTFGKFTAYGWLEDGSVHEDDRTRTRQHFYDPISGTGLTDGLDACSSVG